MAEPQVCSTAVMPIWAPRCSGSDAMVRIVSAAALNSRQGEHDVEVRHREELNLARRHPFTCCCALTLRAMPIAAAVIGDGCVCAVHAARDMATESRGPA